MTPADELGALMDEAARKLASSELGSGAGFHSLPVVFLMGPDGAAKTTVVVNSGLDPELLAGEVFQDGTIVPTELVNVWYAARTVFVEPGPRLRSGQNLWPQFLQRLRSDGGAARAAVVCFSCENFSKPRAMDAAGEAGRQLRARLNEISKTLGVALPVYVLFTKADKVRFFNEFVRRLDDREAAQAVGTALHWVRHEASAYTERETTRFRKSFLDLIYSLCDKRPEFLSRETDGASLGPIYEFPRELRKVREPLLQFLLELGRPGQLQPEPFLRGFYFCGVRTVVIQEPLTAPSAAASAPQAAPDLGATRAFRLDEQMTGLYAVPGAPRFAPRNVSQWILLGEFFSNVLTGDSAGLAAAVRRKSQLPVRSFLAAGIAACLLLAAAMTLSFMRNQAFIHEIRDAANGAEGNGGVASLGALKQLDSLRAALVRLTGSELHGAPWSMRWGLYAGSNAYAEVRRLYFDRFRKLILNETQNNLAGELKSLPAAPGPSDEYAHAYDTLKAWLETTSHHEAAARSFLPPLLEDRWVHGRDIDAERRGLARAQFEFYTDELITANPFFTDDRKEMVDGARKYLIQFGDAMRVYKAMLAEVNRACPPLNLTQRIPESAGILVNAAEVPGGFTKPGFDLMQAAMKNSAKYAGGEGWVLGTQSAAAGNTSLDSKVREFYYAEYVTQWRDYLRKPAIVRYTSAKDAAKKLAVASSPQSPLLGLFWLAAQNVTVNAPEIKGAFGPLQALVPAANGDRYTGPPVANYIASLGKLQEAVEQNSVASSAQKEATAGKVMERAAEARLIAGKTVHSLGQDKDAHIEASIAKLLEYPIAYAEAVSPSGPGVGPLNNAGAAFCKQLSSLLSKKPFRPNAPESATLNDLNATFRPPEGALWMFYGTYLKNLLVKQGGDYVPAPRTGKALTPRFLYFFNKAAQFSAAFYANGPDPSLTFALKPAFGDDIQSVVLTIDGQSNTYAANAVAKQFGWPGNGVRMIAKGAAAYSFSYDGLWGVFDFFNDADKPPPSPEWTVRSGRQGKALLSVRFDLDMLGKPPVFERGYLQNLVCVAEVVSR